MFEHTSRYYNLETALHTLPDGREVAYVRRRFVPPGSSHALLAEVRVAQGDRLDLITGRTLGDALQFWRVADANDAMHPPELVAEPGRLLRIPLP
ncbi:MAG TPA: hypothetical protein VFY65_09070 [Longimicrobium sp.]|nr:hypothetical protein [Longimicrobium sp.]